MKNDYKFVKDLLTQDKPIPSAFIKQSLRSYVRDFYDWSDRENIKVHTEYFFEKLFEERCNCCGHLKSEWRKVSLPEKWILIIKISELIINLNQELIETKKTIKKIRLETKK